jgi:hypothetical protein
MRNRVSVTPASLDRVQVAVTAPHLAAALSALAAKILQTRASVRFGLRVRVMAIRHTFNGKLEFNSHIRQDAQLFTTVNVGESPSADLGARRRES